MLQIANTTGKNSTDSALIIDAMDLLYSGNVDAFALVSSDSDFTSLAIRLRGSGRTVYGMGLRKTPQSLRQAVDRFIFLEDLHDGGAVEEPQAEAAVAEDAEPRRIPDLRRLLERAVNGTSHDDGWASLSSVANHVTRVEPSFSVKDYGASKLVDLVRAQDYLEVEQPERGSVRVRLAASRAGKKSAAKKTAAKKAASQEGCRPRRPPTRRRTTRSGRVAATRRSRRTGAGSRAGEAHRDHPEAVASASGSERVGLHELRQPLELVGVGARQHAVPEVEHVAARGAAGLDDLGGALRSSPRSGRRPGSGRGCPARPGRRPGRSRCPAASASRRRRRRRPPRP